MAIGVYKILNEVNNKVYIGSASVSIDKRFREHIAALRKGSHHSNHLQKAWNKYSEDSFEFLMVEECTVENIVYREQYWIDFYQSFKRDKGYNILEKAYSSIGFRHTEETKRLIGELSKKRGFILKSVLAMQRANTGRKRDKKHSETMSKLHSKPVVQLSLTGELIAEWASAMEAARELSIDSNNITAVCRGKDKSYKGFMWIKKEDYNNDTKYEYKPIINGKK